MAMGRYTILFLAIGLVLWAYATQRDVGAPPEPPALPDHPLLRAKLEAELLLNEGMGLAQLLLARRGEFLPFASVLTEAGEIQHLSDVPGADGKRSGEIVELLEGMLRDALDREGYKAIAVVSDVRFEVEGESSPRPAVQVSLEHRDGYCVNVIVPYRGSGDEIEFQPMLASARSGRVFPDCRRLPKEGEMLVDRREGS
jgi:hypothetical protein